MKSASPALTSFLLNIQDRVPGTQANFFCEDLYTVCVGQGQIVVNSNLTPSGGSITVTPPTIGNTAGAFAHDICVRQASNYTPLTWVASSPAFGQYSVSNSTGVYTFNGSDTGAKLITYAFGYGFYGASGLPLTILNWTSGQLDITYSGITYKSESGPFINRSKITTRIGMAVEKVDCKLIANPTNTLPGPNIPILQAFVQGYMDASAVLVQRLFMPTYGNTSLGTIVQFKGSIGAISEIGRSHVNFEITSRMEVLNRPWPKNLIQIGCGHALFDPGCTLVASSYWVSGTTQAGSNASQINTVLTQPTSTPGPSASPTLATYSPHPGPNLPETRVEWVVQTYVYALGESLPGPEVNTNNINGPNTTIEGSQLLVVDSPASASGAIGWNCYIGSSQGDEQLQNLSPIPLGTNWLESFTGPVQGTPPPLLATNGYFALGTIIFTSGVNYGVSRTVVSYLTVSGYNVVSVLPPFPNAPAAGDSFIIQPGCDKNLSTCINRYNNGKNFFGFPFTPSPDTAN